MSASAADSPSYSSPNDRRDVAELDGRAPAVIAAFVVTGLLLALPQFALQAWTLVEIAVRIAMSNPSS